MNLTPTEQRIFDLLRDGLPHSLKEIHSLLWDELTELQTARQHLSNIRAKIKPRGLNIINHPHGKNGSATYQLMQRYTPSPG